MRSVRAAIGHLSELISSGQFLGTLQTEKQQAKCRSDTPDLDRIPAWQNARISRDGVSGAEEAMLLSGTVKERAIEINVSMLCDEPSNRMGVRRSPGRDRIHLFLV